MASDQEFGQRGRTAHAWLFYLVVPAPSEHVFWVVVERAPPPDGSIAVHSYGFN